MKIIVVCGNEDCSTEFTANTEDEHWVCPKCQRIIQNKQYPFLDVKYMDACARPDNADWKALYLDLLDRARQMIRERDSEIQRLKDIIRSYEQQPEIGSD